MNADYINPFLIAATKVLKEMVFIDAKIGKAYAKDTRFENQSLLIMLGVTGKMKGQVILDFNEVVALDVASKMCMMPLDEMNDLAQSAVCELGNMILGNTATVFSTKGIGIGITPPTICNGPVTFTNMYTSNICIPLIYEEDKVIEINVALGA